MACPPLPVITGNMVSGVQMEEARKHFVCKASSASGAITPARYDEAVRQSQLWIGRERGRFLEPEVFAKAVEYGTIPDPETGVRVPTPYTGATVTVNRATTDDGRSAGVGPPEVQPSQPSMAPRAGPLPIAQEANMIGALGALPGLIGTVGTVGGGISSVLGGIGGGSRCPGPYNYVEGVGCVPKADYARRISGGSNPCPTGYRWNGTACVEEGVGGTVARILPGGDTGYGSDIYGQAVVGAFGRPGIVPATEPITTRRCPPGMVLGKDDVCYARSSIRNSDRKWPKPPRPVLSASDMKTIRRIKTLQNRVKKAAQTTGFSCKKR